MKRFTQEQLNALRDSFSFPEPLLPEVRDGLNALVASCPLEALIQLAFSNIPHVATVAAGYLNDRPIGDEHRARLMDLVSQQQQNAEIKT